MKSLFFNAWGCFAESCFLDLAPHVSRETSRPPIAPSKDGAMFHVKPFSP
jgi:hypothetical protein